VGFLSFYKYQIIVISNILSLNDLLIIRCLYIDVLTSNDYLKWRMMVV
jgi:hypothetical protein